MTLLNEIVARKNFSAIISNLAVTDAANLITLTDSDHDLSDRLDEFALAWRKQESFPTTLKPYCSSLLEKIASKASDLDVWKAVAELLIEFDKPRTLPNVKNVPSHMRTPSQTSVAARDVAADWTRPYFPDSLHALQSLIREYQQLDIKQYYARTLVFVQSSGMGKSRLVDAFGQKCPMINFILREKETTGFPPGDDDILSFLREKPSINEMNNLRSLQNTYSEVMATVAWNHTLAVALLQASFEECKLRTHFYKICLLIQMTHLIRQYLG